MSLVPSQLPRFHNLKMKGFGDNSSICRQSLGWSFQSFRALLRPVRVYVCVWGHMFWMVETSMCRLNRDRRSNNSVVFS